MRPEPPHLTEAATEWSPGEIRWIVANGIKMTGMPAFGRRHPSGDIVAIAAFVSALPGLSADDYRSLLEPGSEHEQAPPPSPDGSPDQPTGTPTPDTE
jgi:mono/diheme cytochrome c family protein